MAAPLAEEFKKANCTIVAEWFNRTGYHLRIAAPKETMALLGYGNERAWKTMIADNEPEDDGLMYVAIREGSDGGEVRMTTGKQARQHARQHGFRG